LIGSIIVYIATQLRIIEIRLDEFVR
jgi:hypothetical protein